MVLHNVYYIIILCISNRVIFASISATVNQRPSSRNVSPYTSSPSDSTTSVELEVICGSMYSGKSSLLLSRIKSSQHNNEKVQIFKHSLDDRYTHKNRINTHDGKSSQEDAIKIKCAKDILLHLDEDTEVIAIDEAQFLDDDIVPLCQFFLHFNHEEESTSESIPKSRKRRNLKKIIVAGLDLDFRGEPFGPMPQLMALAHKVVKLHAKCVCCGNRNIGGVDVGGGRREKDFAYHSTISNECSTVTQRMVNGQPANYQDQIIMVGAEEVYEARCRKCFQILDAPYQNMRRYEKDLLLVDFQK